MVHKPHRAQLPEIVILRKDIEAYSNNICVVLKAIGNILTLRIISGGEEGKVIKVKADNVIRDKPLPLLPLPARLDASCECPICLENLKTPSGFPIKAHYWRGCCASTICETCFWRLWSTCKGGQSGPKCPLCRAEMIQYDTNHLQCTEERVARGNAFAAYALGHDLLTTPNEANSSLTRWYPDHDQGMQCLRLSAALGYRWACADYACRLFNAEHGPSPNNLEACAILEALLKDDLTQRGDSAIIEEEPIMFETTAGNCSHDESMHKNSSIATIFKKTSSVSDIQSCDSSNEHNFQSTRSNRIFSQTPYRDRLCLSLGLVAYQSANQQSKLRVPRLLVTAVYAFLMVSGPDAFKSVHRDVAIIALVAMLRMVQVFKQGKISAAILKKFLKSRRHSSTAAILSHASLLRSALEIPANTRLPPPFLRNFDDVIRDLLP